MYDQPLVPSSLLGLTTKFGPNPASEVDTSPATVVVVSSSGATEVSGASTSPGVNADGGITAISLPSICQYKPAHEPPRNWKYQASIATGFPASMVSSPVVLVQPFATQLSMTELPSIDNELPSSAAMVMTTERD